MKIPLLVALLSLSLLAPTPQASANWYGTDGPDTHTNAVTITIGNYWGSPESGNFGAIDSGNQLTNEGTTTLDMRGSYNLGINSVGGSNIITNSGEIGHHLVGSWNVGVLSNGGGNNVLNTGVVGAGADMVVGSWNLGQDSFGGSNTVINGAAGLINGTMVGARNESLDASGGYNDVINNGGNITGNLIGSDNTGDHSSGDYNIVINTGAVQGHLHGSANQGANTAGSGNIINNAGQIVESIFGSSNEGQNTSGGENIVVNNTGGQTGSALYGSANLGAGSSGGGNVLLNDGQIDAHMIGSLNAFANTTGGGNYMYNEGQVDGDLVGSRNQGAGSTGGGNTIDNSGLVMLDLVGSANTGADSTGATNEITNTADGVVEGNVIGSWNQGEASSGGGNIIINAGRIEGSIHGSMNSGEDSSSLGNTITNTGVVLGSMVGGSGDDALTNSGQVGGDIRGGDGNDAILLSGGAFPGGVTDGGAGIDSLSFSNMGLVHGGAGDRFTGFEHFIIAGGDNTIDGLLSIAGPSVIQAGSLHVYGMLATTELTVQGPGLLGGNGRIGGNVINYGVISPGNGITALTIDGSLTFQPGSVYAVQLNARESDLLRVGGTAYIHGGSVHLGIERDLYQDAHRWVLIVAQDGVSGRFDSLRFVTSETLDVVLRYSANEVYLELERTPYATFGDSPAQQTVGSALDDLLAEVHGPLRDLLVFLDFNVTRAGLQAVLAALNPEIYTAFTEAGLHTMDRANRLTEDRQSSAREFELRNPEARDQGHGWNVWADSLGEWADRDGAGGLMGHTQDTLGLMVGADRRFGDALRAGLAMGASYSDLGWDGTPHDASMRGTHLGAYASFDRGGYFLDGHLGFANFDNEADRWLGLNWAGLADRAKGEFDANAWYARLKGGHVFQAGDWLLTPAASMQYAHLCQDGFVESSAGFLDERILSADRDAVSGSLSARVSRRIDAGAWRLTPHVQAEWLHRFDDDPASITASFTAIESEPFTVAGLAPVEEQVVIGAGVQGEYGNSLTVSLTLGASFAGEYDARSIGAGLTWKF